MLRKRPFWLNVISVMLTVSYVFTVFTNIQGTNGLLTLCLIFVVVANIDQFKRLKIGTDGITAEAREVLRKTEDRLKEIRELAKLTAQTSLALVIRQGRLGGFEQIDAEQVKNKLLEHLSEVGVPKHEFDDVLRDWHRYTLFDYVHMITNRNHVPDALSENQIEEWRQLRRYEWDNPPSPDSLSQFLDCHDLLTGERREMISAYRHYLMHNQHIDLQKWRDWKGR